MKKNCEYNVYVNCKINTKGISTDIFLIFLIYETLVKFVKRRTNQATVAFLVSL